MFRGTPDSSPILVVAFGTKVFGMHPRTGQRLWSREVGNLSGALRVVLRDDRVYVLGSELVCLEYATGRTLWKTELGEITNGETLLVSGDMIFVAASGEAAAFDASTGKQAWYDPFKGEGFGTVALALPDVAAQADS